MTSTWPGALLLAVPVLSALIAPARAEVAVDPQRFGDPATVCLAVHNQLSYGIAEYVDSDARVVARAGSWLGRHSVFLLERPAADTRIRLVSLREVPAQASDFSIRECPRDFPPEAVADLARAQSHRLARFLGEDGVADAATIETWLKTAAETLEASGHSLWAGVANFESAAFLRREGRLGEAGDFYERAQSWFQAAQAPDQQASALNSRGLVAWREGRSDTAEVLFRAAMHIRVERDDGFEVAAIANNLGLLANQQGNHSAAADYYERALSVFQGDLDLRADLTGASADELLRLETLAVDLPSALNTLNNLALVHRTRGLRALAERYWRNYIALETLIPRVEAGSEARLNLALLLLDDGRLDEALMLLLDARAAFEQAGSGRWLADSLIALGRLYLLLGDSAMAEDFARQGLAAAGDDVALQAVALSLLASLHRMREDWGAALDFETRARSIHEQSEARRSLIRTHSNLAWTRFLAGQTQPALRELETLYVDFDLQPEDRLGATIASRIGEIQLALGEPETAVATLNDALAAQERSDDVFGQFETLKRLGRAYRALDDPTELDVRRQAIDRIDSIYRLRLPPLRRAEFLAASRGAYDDLVLALIARGKQEEAWDVAWQARARGLRDLQQTRQRRLSGPRRRQLLDRRARLLADYFATAGADASVDRRSADVSPLNRWRLEIDRLDSELEDLVVSNAPTASAPALDDIQSMLEAGEVFLSYYLAGNAPLVWSITDDHAHLVELDDSLELDAPIAALLERLRHPRRAIGALNQAAATLQNVLLKPLNRDLKGAQKVLVQLDGALHSVPFSLLLAHAGLEPGAVIRVLDGRLDRIQNADSPGSGAGILVLADPGWTDESADAGMYPEHSLIGRLIRDRSLGRLPGTRVEAEAIASLKLENLTVDLRTGRRATREFVINGGLAGHRRIHIATHGLVDLEYPALSSLLLASATAIGPAFLRPNDIAELDLRADLVVLSGCETGHGRILAGEGAMSLARPFHIAGARQVLASLWKIDDHRTALFMERFYRHLLIDRNSAAEALARAQAATRQDPATSHPYYWAGFVLSRSQVDG